MTTVLEIDGKKLHTIKAATSLVDYSADYITRLAREGKITASHVGRNWYIDIDSLKHYQSVMEMEQTIRKQKLSEERKQERSLREEIAERKIIREKTHRAQAARTKVVVASAVLAGLFSGYLFETTFSQLTNPEVQVASTSAAPSLALLTTDVAPVPEVVTMLASSAEADVYTADFTTVPDQVRSFASSTEGILLLPSQLSEGELLELKDLFSDRIVVRIDASGQKFVSQVNGQSEIIGTEIPVITVPLNHQSP